MPTEYDKLKVAELKDVLKQRGIPQTGLSRKQQFIDALLSDDEKTNAPVPSDAADPVKNVSGTNEAEEDEKMEVAVEAAPVTEESEAAAPKVEPVGVEAKRSEEIAEMEDPPERVEKEVAQAEPADEVAMESTPTLLATPQPASDAPEEVSSDLRKRKRRSLTPDPSDESVSKKLKAADGIVSELIDGSLPNAGVKETPEENAQKIQANEVIEDANTQADEIIENNMVHDAPVPIDGTADGETAQPYGSSDDMLRDAPPETTTSDAVLETATSNTPAPEDTPRDVTSLHAPTRALYIRDIIRPLQPTQLQEHLISLILDATPDAIEIFHLDLLRTHAFALFSSTSIAMTVRKALHNTVFPPEPTRKPLWVDYIPEDKVQQWIDAELQAGGTSRRDAKRWEVEYDDSYGAMQATLREVRPGMPGPAPQPRQTSTSLPTQTQGQGMGMPNAPSGPRAKAPRQNDLSSAPHAARASQDTLHPSRLAHASEDRDLTNPTPQKSDSVSAPFPPSFTALDSKFSATASKPKLYFLPQNREVADKRLAVLTRETSRDWNGRATADRHGGGGGVEGQLRRYTFEDGDRLVDGGPDRGNFGFPMSGGFGGGRGGGGFGGRGRGGGFRGRR
ncbi:hypothetical protein LTR62_002923 [Meristemomyces frigidus]|uniref:SAP domain-containing protein n=1 Tax=Meristemomyces frigidus TaxID=1508187 RepID=A0AAN7TJS7_9PEZI|nr:hypothetical protein LTR62_002923 [Meristemomyces frigidus]